MNKKIFILILILLLGMAGILVSFFLNKQISGFDNYANFEKINYNLEGKNLQLLKADTSEKWTKGLMYFRKLEGVDGMIFIFPDKQKRTFWNKNTYLDLDLYWIEGEKVVGKSSLPSIEKSKEIVIVESPKAVDKVIELQTSNL